MNEQLQQVIQLFLAAAQGDQNALQQAALIVGAAMQGDLQSAQIVQAVILTDESLGQFVLQLAQQMQGQAAQAARFGAKLNYIRQLRGVCPKGTRPAYFKDGGRVCKRCIELEREREQITYDDPIEAFKCGGKKVKKDCGGAKVKYGEEGLAAPQKKKVTKPQQKPLQKPQPKRGEVDDEEAFDWGKDHPANYPGYMGQPVKKQTPAPKKNPVPTKKVNK